MYLVFQLLTPFPVTLQMQHIRSPEGVHLQQTAEEDMTLTAFTNAQRTV